MDGYLDPKQVGYVPRLVRAPYGASSPLLKRIVADNKRELVFWTVDTKNWEGSPVSAMRANVNKNTHPGGIILMHSFGSKHIANTVQLLAADHQGSGGQGLQLRHGQRTARRESAASGRRASK